jgi:DNA-binding CsgD family transcriptional regulator/tetratricopeptide (TPR) repeat protein
MYNSDRCIGRDRELAQLRLAIGDGTDGLRLSMLTGPSGLGKTTLTTVAVAEAADRGFRIAVAQGRAGSLSTPFAPWREALPEFADLLADASRPDAALDMESLGGQLVALLAEVTEKQPLLLVFDDAQALDESSLALMPYAVGVSDKLDLSILIVEQNDAVDVPASYRAFVDGLVARRVVRHLELGPMSDDSIMELVRAVLDLEADAEIPTEIVLRAQGNPWFAQELADAWRRGTTEIPVSIAAAATSRINSLPENAQDIVYAIALGSEGAHIGWLEALSEEKPRQFVRTMELIKVSGLVREDGEVLTIAHPLMQQALLDELSAAMKRALHLELATVVAKVPMNEVTSARALGYHLGQAGKPDEAVEHYLKAAESNEILGQLHEALVDYDRALVAEPRIDQRGMLLKKCAYAAMQVGSDRAVDYWTELGRVAAARRDNDLYGYALFHQYWTCNDGTATDRLDRAVALGADEFGWAARAAACLCTLRGEYSSAIDHDTRALELAREGNDVILETLALEKLAMAYGYTGRLDDAIAASREAVALATANRLHGWAWHAWTTLVESLADDLQTERSIIEAQSIRKYVEDLHLTRTEPVVLASLARALARAGRLEDARVAVDKAVEMDAKLPANQYRAIVLWSRAQVLVDCGDSIVAAPAVQQAVAAAAENGFTSWMFEAGFSESRLAALLGDVDGAIARANDLEIDEPVAMATLALWLVRLGVQNGRDDAIMAGSKLRVRIEEDDNSPLLRQLLLEIDVAVEAARTGNVEALQHVAGAWNDAGRVLDGLRAQLMVGTLQAREGRSQEAVATLSAVRSKCADIGATWDADVAARRLRDLGTRSRAKSRSTQVGNLTKRELQISRLVASGLKNSEVAAQLFLAEKTVAAHLSNIYGKLEVKSRVQLASWLQENDPDLHSAQASA